MEFLRRFNTYSIFIYDSNLFYSGNMLNGVNLDEYVRLQKVKLSSLRVHLVREFWRGGEIFNLKCLVQFLEGEGRGANLFKI